MKSWPEDLPQDVAPEQRLDAAEERALLALAEELREVCPDPAVSPEFEAGVRHGLARPWTLMRTLESSRLARAAATVMVIVVGVAPVVALVRMLPWLREERPPLGFELPAPPPEVTDRRAEDLLPALPPLEAAADEAVVESRLRRAAASWRAAGPTVPDAGDPPRIHLWPSASAEDLWQEFLRRCGTERPEPVPPALAARVLELALSAPAADRPALAPWMWVLRGEILPAAEARAAYGWSGAPWFAGR